VKRRKRELLPEPAPLKHDPVEDTEYFKAVAEEVEREAEAMVAPTLANGSNHNKHNAPEC